ncbi:hypothetical protein PV327_000060, partial [Microctonus hyperodae]
RLKEELFDVVPRTNSISFAELMFQYVNRGCMHYFVLFMWSMINVNIKDASLTLKSLRKQSISSARRKSERHLEEKRLSYRSVN